MANPKQSDIERLGDVLAKSLKRLDLAPRLDEYGVWAVWNEVVGPAIARNAQPEKSRNGTLFIKVSSPVWMQQLQFMKEMIVDKLNQKLKAPLVKNIFFMVGRIDTAAAGIDAAAESAPAALQPTRPVDDRFIESIADEEVRDAFKKLLKSFARRELKR
jgi:predicted nucleic acid-binding Zn ribbon protein